MNYRKELLKFGNYLKDHASPGTVRTYIYALGLWFDYLNGSSVSHESAQKYVDLVTKTRSPSTASLRAHAIMRYFKWKGEDISLDCPTVRMGDPDYLLLDQVEELLAKSGTILEEVLVTVLFDTAVRISELLNLELDDIDWGNKLISVTRKGGRKELVNISDKGLLALDKWLNARVSKSKKVFMDISYQDAWATLKALGKRAGIPVHPHIFRHSRAIMMLMNGAELHIVQQHLGHASIATTANIYGRFKAVHLRELVPSW